MDWEIFRDQIWNFIGVTIACITLIITLIIYFLQKNKKGISYEVLSKTPLLTIREKLEGKIKILYLEREVQNVTFLEIKILNTGNVGIPSADYERPIRFIFDNNAEILSAEVIRAEPETLSTSLTIHANEITLEPVLMNSKDYISMKVIISNSAGEAVYVDGRIKDVKEIKKQGSSYMYLFLVIIGFIFLAIGIFQLASTKKVDITPWTTQKWIGVGLITLGYLFIGISMFSITMKLLRNRYKQI